MNIQSTRLKTDTEDNKVSNRYQKHTTDYRDIAVLVAVGVIGALLIWVIVWSITRVDCYFNGSCAVMTYVFYGYNIFIGVGLLIGVLFLAARLYQAIRNSAFLRGMSMPIHRNDIRTNVDKAYAVETELAKSEMYRGLDALTNSPSYHNNVKESDKNNPAGIYSPHLKPEDELDPMDYLALLRSKGDTNV